MSWPSENKRISVPRALSDKKHNLWHDLSAWSSPIHVKVDFNQKNIAGLEDLFHSMTKFSQNAVQPKLKDQLNEIWHKI